MSEKKKSRTKYTYSITLMDTFFTQKEIRKLRNIPGGDTYTIIYQRLQLLSIKNGGNLYFTGTEKSIAEQLSFEIDEDIAAIEMTLNYLLANNLASINDSYDVFLPQALQIGKTTTDAADRMRKMRKGSALLDHDSFTKNKAILTTKKERDSEIKNSKRFKDLLHIFESEFTRNLSIADQNTLMQMMDQYTDEVIMYGLRKALIYDIKKMRYVIRICQNRDLEGENGIAA